MAAGVSFEKVVVIAGVGSPGKILTADEPPPAGPAISRSLRAEVSEDVIVPRVDSSPSSSILRTSALRAKLWLWQRELTRPQRSGSRLLGGRSLTAMRAWRSTEQRWTLVPTQPSWRAGWPRNRASAPGRKGPRARYAQWSWLSTTLHQSWPPLIRTSRPRCMPNWASA